MLVPYATSHFQLRNQSAITCLNEVHSKVISFCVQLLCVYYLLVLETLDCFPTVSMGPQKYFSPTQITYNNQHTFFFPVWKTTAEGINQPFLFLGQVILKAPHIYSWVFSMRAVTQIQDSLLSVSPCKAMAPRTCLSYCFFHSWWGYNILVLKVFHPG